MSNDCRAVAVGMFFLACAPLYAQTATTVVVPAPCSESTEIGNSGYGLRGCFVSKHGQPPLLPELAPLIFAQVQQKVDLLYSSHSEGAFTCNLGDGIFNGGRPEYYGPSSRQNHPNPHGLPASDPNGASCGQYAQIVIGFNPSTFTIPFTSTTCLTSSPNITTSVDYRYPNSFFEKAYLHGATVQAASCYYNKIIKPLSTRGESGIYSLTVQANSTCNAAAVDLTAQIQQQGANQAALQQNLQQAMAGQPNVPDIWNSSASWNNIPSTDSNSIGPLRQSAMALAATRSSLEAAFEMLVACEIESRAENATSQLSTSAEIVSVMKALGSQMAQQCQTYCSGVFNPSWCSIPSQSQLQQCANACYEGIYPPGYPAGPNGIIDLIRTQVYRMQSGSSSTSGSNWPSDGSGCNDNPTFPQVPQSSNLPVELTPLLLIGSLRRKSGFPGKKKKSGRLFSNAISFLGLSVVAIHISGCSCPTPAGAVGAVLLSGLVGNPLPFMLVGGSCNSSCPGPDAGTVANCTQSMTASPPLGCGSDTTGVTFPGGPNWGCTSPTNGNCPLNPGQGVAPTVSYSPGATGYANCVKDFTNQCLADNQAANGPSSGNCAVTPMPSPIGSPESLCAGGSCPPSACGTPLGSGCTPGAITPVLGGGGDSNHTVTDLVSPKQDALVKSPTRQDFAPGSKGAAATAGGLKSTGSGVVASVGNFGQQKTQGGGPGGGGTDGGSIPGLSDHTNPSGDTAAPSPSPSMLEADAGKYAAVGGAGAGSGASGVYNGRASSGLEAPTQGTETFGDVSSDGAMGTPDPEDYFTRIGLEDNIFKIVERRYGQKALGWSKADLMGLKK